MAYARLLRIWNFTYSPVRCFECRQWIKLVKDDRGKTLPFAVKAMPIRPDVDEDEVVRFLIFDPSTAFHQCPKKPRVTPAAGQERFL